MKKMTNHRLSIYPGFQSEIAVFTPPFSFRGVIKREVFKVETYQQNPGEPRMGGGPLKVYAINAIELEEGSGVFWPVSRTSRVQSRGWSDECRIWGVYHVQINSGRLPKDLYQSSQLEFWS